MRTHRWPDGPCFYLSRYPVEINLFALDYQEGEEEGATAAAAEGGEEEVEEEPQGADVEAAAEVAAHVLDNVVISPQEYQDLKKK